MGTKIKKINDLNGNNFNFDNDAVVYNFPLRRTISTETYIVTKKDLLQYVYSKSIFNDRERIIQFKKDYVSPYNKKVLRNIKK